MSDPAAIRVAIVDDHAVVRSGLAAFLLTFDDFELVGEAQNGRSAVELCNTVLPDVVLMDLVMPDMDGAAATRAIRQAHPEVQVIALTSFQEGELIQEVLQAGAIGYLLKDVSADELAAAIRSARAGRPTLAPEATRVLIAQSVGGSMATPGYDLSSREREVLALMARGMNNPDIATELVIGRSTVKFHVSSILAKLGAATRTEAVALALQNRLV
jgi:two-component system, NarL family, response regulator LiaR